MSCSYIDGQERCIRNVYGEGEYCLFHKPNKTDDEAKMFWKIINFKRYNEEIGKYEALINSPTCSQEDVRNHSQAIHLLIEQQIGENFSQKERSKTNYQETKEQALSYLRSIQSSRGWHNFNGFVFPTSNDIKFRYENTGSVNHWYVFDNCVFEGSVDFSGYSFLGSVSFKNVVFQSRADFTDAIFHRNVEFTNFKMNSGVFRNVSFLGDNVEFISKDVSFGPSLFGVKFGENTQIVLEVAFPRESGLAAFGEDAYRIAKNQALKIGDYIRAGDYYYEERVFRRRQLIPDFSWRIFSKRSEKGKRKFVFLKNMLANIRIMIEYRGELWRNLFDYFMGEVTGYGEKPRRIIVASLASVWMFTVLNMAFGSFGRMGPNITTAGQLLHMGFWRSLEESLFLSLVSFSTLGAGIASDARIEGFTKFMISAESIIGAVFMSLFVLTIVKRYSRG